MGRTSCRSRRCSTHEDAVRAQDVGGLEHSIGNRLERRSPLLLKIASFVAVSRCRVEYV